jgi:transposase
MVGRVTQMPGLIVHPGQIWLVVEPVDMRRGIY